jgi:hypothetical protein
MPLPQFDRSGKIIKPQTEDFYLLYSNIRKSNSDLIIFGKRPLTQQELKNPNIKALKGQDDFIIIERPSIETSLSEPKWGRTESGRVPTHGPVDYTVSTTLDNDSDYDQRRKLRSPAKINCFLSTQK